MWYQYKIRVIFFALFVVLSLTGCGSNAWQAGKKAEVIEARSEVFSMQAEPNNIVLMLPLKGDLAATSQAIRNGFLAAYYHARKERPGVKVKIVDTTDSDMPVLYQQIVADGAEVIVGPLTKREVDSIASLDSLPVPVVSLNTLDNYTQSFRAHLYQFGLLPQDEAIQVAIKMVQEQHDRVAIIAPENVWGNKIVDAFKNKYEDLGGMVVDTLRYNSSVSLSEQICPFLAEDANELCVAKKSNHRKQDIPNELMRRQDINAIFLVAQASKARQIVPLLKFYYAGDLPTYSISAIYSGIPSQNLDRDIDGVYFCDIPWMLQDPITLDDNLQNIHKQIMTQWADSYTSRGRLYALGVDAYNLASKLNIFLNSPQHGITGATGILYLDDFNHIYRELQWAQMREGLPVGLP